MSSVHWWLAGGTLAAVLVTVVLCPTQMLQELLQQAFLAVREPFATLKDWSQRGFRTTWLWLKTALLGLGLTRQNWARRVTLLMILGVSFVIGLTTFILNLLPSFSGLLGHGDEILRRIPLSLEGLIALELGVATLAPAILLSEILGITKLGMDVEMAALRPVAKGLLAVLLASIMASSIYLTWSSGRLRALGFAAKPAQELAQAPTETAALYLGPAAETSVPAIPANSGESLPSPVFGGQSHLEEQYENTAATLMTWLPVLSMAAGTVSFLAFPHMIILLSAVPILTVVLALVGLCFLVGTGGERIVNAGYNVSHACLTVLGHLGGEFRDAVGWRPAWTPRSHNAPGDVSHDSATGRSDGPAVNAVPDASPDSAAATSILPEGAPAASAESSQRAEAAMWNPLNIDGKNSDQGQEERGSV